VPKAFSSDERGRIYERLLQAGRECWEQYGIRRTSVDDLAKRAGISKGTFYLFFESKELFFLEVLEKSHSEIKQRLMEVLKSEDGSPRERFLRAVMKVYDEIRNNRWLIRLMADDGEYEYLLRKLPEEKIKQHIIGDDRDTEHLLQLLGAGNEFKAPLISAALRGLFLLMLHREEVGEDHFEEVFKLMLEGVAIRVFGK